MFLDFLWHFRFYSSLIAYMGDGETRSKPQRQSFSYVETQASIEVAVVDNVEGKLWLYSPKKSILKRKKLVCWIWRVFHFRELNWTYTHATHLLFLRHENCSIDQKLLPWSSCVDDEKFESHFLSSIIRHSALEIWNFILSSPNGILSLFYVVLSCLSPIPKQENVWSSHCRQDSLWSAH